jgi:hypothetical protein
MRREIPKILQNALLDANSGEKRWSYAYCACCGTNSGEGQHSTIRDTSGNDGYGNYIAGSKVYVDGNTPEELVSKGMPLDAIKEGWRPFFIMKDKDGHSFGL